MSSVDWLTDDAVCRMTWLLQESAAELRQVRPTLSDAIWRLFAEIAEDTGGLDMEATVDAMGFSLCDSSAVRAVAKRRIGSLPYAVALGSADVGEAKLEDGRRVLITWGRNLSKAEQFWHAHNTLFTPVWVGSDDGSCELIIGDTFGSSAPEDWLWLGIRIQLEGDVTWLPTEGTDG